MRKLGIFSGIVYSAENYSNNIKECAIQIPSKFDGNAIENLFKSSHIKCKGCLSCPVAKSGKIGINYGR